MEHNKISCLELFNSEYSELNEADQQTFSLVCNKLLNENFIYGQRNYDEAVYRGIKRLREVVENYFLLIDYELYHDDNYKIFYLKSKNERMRVKLNKLETVILLICAKLYFTKSLDLSYGDGVEVVISIKEIIDELDKTRIYKVKLNKTDVFNSLKSLKNYKILDYNFASNSNNIDIVKILPTILYVVTSETVDDIVQRLNSLSFEDNSEGDQDNENF